MTRLAVTVALSLLVAWILCYGALRTAERIAAHQLQQTQQTIEQTEQ